MPIVKIERSNKNKLAVLEFEAFSSEREMEELIDKNLDYFGLEILKDQYIMNCNFIIDTLAYDPQTRTLVIIEYKNKESKGVIEQSLGYSSIIKNSLVEQNKILADFTNIEPNWDLTRVMIISPSYSNHQLANLAEFQRNEERVQLWKCRKYQTDLVDLHEIKDIAAIITAPRMTRGMTTNYTIQDIIEKRSNEKYWDNVGKLWDAFESGMNSFSDFRYHFTKITIGLYHGSDRCFLVLFRSDHIKVNIELENFAENAIEMRDLSEVTETVKILKKRFLKWIDR